MKATEKPILEFLRGPKQFCVPIFQRRYSWKQKDCEQLWEDVLAAGEDRKMKWHFLGSIVYLEPELQNMGSVLKFPVIDGQQRLTTLSLLLLALSKVIEDDTDIDIDITPEKLSNDYLFNYGEEGESHLKLFLTKGDNETFDYLLKGEDDILPRNPSSILIKNYRFFEKMLKNVDLNKLCAGLEKLMIVDIVLERNENNPQKIFESLNSTGVLLSEADKIRNYVLLGHKTTVQTELYQKYWFPIEQCFEKKASKSSNAKVFDSKDFDKFMRHYLTLKTCEFPNLKDIYEKFKEEFPDHMLSSPDDETEEILGEILRYARHYVDITDNEDDPELEAYLKDIRDLNATVVYPYLLKVYDCYKQGDIEKTEVIKTLQLIESYVFRRDIRGFPRANLNQIFLSILRDMSKGDIINKLKSLDVTLLNQPFHRRFPQDDEFKKALLTKDIYNLDRTSRRCLYILRRLENHEHKEPINVADYTVEHVMPQTLTPEWRKEFGEDFGEIQLLHTIGNLTLTGYNPEYSNRSFKEKRDMEKGFRQSHLYLNESLARAEQWNLSAILTRAKELAEKACEIWIYPKGDDDLSIERNNNFPSSQQKLAATTSVTTTGYGTSSNSTSMADWSEWEQELGWIIIEMLEYRDPAGLMVFEPRDIQDYYPRLQKKFPNNNSISETVSKMLGSLVNRGELEKPNWGEYRLVEGELLHSHLKLRITEKELTKKNQKIAELEDKLFE